MRTIPNPATLRDVVSEVVQQNKAIGYDPIRFIQATVGRTEGELILACDKLLRRALYTKLAKKKEGHE